MKHTIKIVNINGIITAYADEDTSVEIINYQNGIGDYSRLMEECQQIAVEGLKMVDDIEVKECSAHACTCKNTRIEYLYRDASNYKCDQQFVVAGRFTMKDIDRIMVTLDSGEFFAPESVGMPLVRDWDYGEDDHDWCELHETDFVLTDEEPDDPNLTVEELVQRFENMKNKWA